MKRKPSTNGQRRTGVAPVSAQANRSKSPRWERMIDGASDAEYLNCVDLYFHVDAPEETPDDVVSDQR
jgi:hypothetical protein